MASLLQRLAIKGLGIASPEYQVGAHFEALGGGVLMAPSKSIRYFFAILSCPEVQCWGYIKKVANNCKITLRDKARGCVKKLPVRSL